MPKTIGASSAKRADADLAKPFQQVRFIASAAEPQQLPADEGAEVAFVGRSNAGKSSAINAICGRRRLAFVSRTPGRTQLINLFALTPGTTLVDLPGYGFARVPAEIRSRWEHLLGYYLSRRAALKGLLIVVDARHGITDLDRNMMDWFAPSNKPVHILLTKCDKLGRQEQMRQLSAARRILSDSFPVASVQLFSSVSGEGLDEARRMILGLLEAGE
jgi:GTP-binding protein